MTSNISPSLRHDKEWLVLGDVQTGAVPKIIPISVVNDPVGTSETATMKNPIHLSGPWVEDKFHSILVAQDESTVASVEASVSDSGVRFQIQRYSLSTAEQQVGSQLSVPVPVPEQVTGIYVHRSAVYLGFATSVGWIDFSSATSPTYERIYVNLHVGSSTSKAYDMFVCNIQDNMLVAIDDCCFPFYADTFLLDPKNGRPVHVRHWELPWLVNGHYTMAAGALFGNHQEWNLFLVNEFSHRGGSGQTLWRLENFSSQKTFAARPKGTTLTEIHRANGTSDTLAPQDSELPSTTNSGDRVSLAVRPDFITDDEDIKWMEIKWMQHFNEQWKALAITTNQLLLAAGTRGLLSLPLDFDPDTKAITNPNLRGLGRVSDVTVLDNDAVWVLLESPPFDPDGTVNGRLLTNDRNWQVIKLGSDRRIQVRIPIRGSPNLHFVGANGRKRSSYRSVEDAQRYCDDNDDL